MLVILCALSSDVYAQNDTFTTEQKSKLKQFAQESRQSSLQLREALHSARKKLNTLYEPKQIDKQNAQKAFDALSKAQQDLLMFHFHNQLFIRENLSEQQFQEILSKFNNRKHRGAHRFGMDDPINSKLLDALNLTLQQNKKLSGLNAFKKRRYAESQLLRDTTKKLMDIYKEYRINKTEAIRIIAAIHKRQNRLTQLSHKRMLLLHSVLSGSQLKQLQSLMQNANDRKGAWENDRNRESEHSLNKPENGYPN